MGEAAYLPLVTEKEAVAASFEGPFRKRTHTLKDADTAKELGPGPGQQPCQ